jgi:hypothetical protein
MKTTKTVWRVLVCLATFAGVAIAQPVTFSATPQKGSYRRGEPVKVEFTITNASNHDILVGSTFGLNYFIELHIEGPNGIAHWCGRISGGKPRGKLFSVLRPGAHVNRLVTISCPAPRTFGYDMSSPGVYRITAQYKIPTPKEGLQSAVAPDVEIVMGPIPASRFEVTITSE